MEPLRRYNISDKIYGKSSPDLIFIVRNIPANYQTVTYTARSQKIIPQYGPFIAYDYKTEHLLEALAKIIEKNMLQMSTCVSLDLEATLNFLLKTKIDLTSLPYFSKVFPEYQFITDPYTFHDYSFVKPERTESVEFLFPHIFVGQKVFLGEKLKLEMKTSSGNEDYYFIGSKTTKEIKDKREQLYRLRNKLAISSGEKAELDIRLETVLQQLMENSNILEIKIDRNNAIKRELNEELSREIEEIEEKWNIVYKNYEYRRQMKIQNINDEIEQLDDVEHKDRIEALIKRKVRLESEITKGHGTNRHEEQLKEIDDLYKEKMSEIDKLTEEESKEIIDKNRELNDEIETIQTKLAKIEKDQKNLSETIDFETESIDQLMTKIDQERDEQSAIA